MKLKTILTTLALTAMLAFSAQVAKAADSITVPTVSQPVRAGQPLTADLLMMMDYPSSRVPSTAILDKKSLIGKEATRSLRPGLVIYANSVRIPPDVRKSGEVTMVFNKPGLQLTTLGEALEDGAVGETIKVMNSDSKRIVIGKIIAPGTVQVQ